MAITKGLSRLWSSFRAGGRLAAIAGAVLGLIAAQRLIVGPIFRNYEVMPRLLGQVARRLVGIKMEFKGAAIARDKSMMYVGNHISFLDPVLVKGFLPGVCIAKEDMGDWPVLGPAGRAVGTIYIKRPMERNGGLCTPQTDLFQPGVKNSLPQVHAQMTKAFNKGKSVIFFPESTTGPGDDVMLFKTGALSILFNNRANPPEAIVPDVRIQPFSIKIAKINGKPVTTQAERDVFAWYGDNMPLLGHTWNLLKQRSVTLEVTSFPVVNPKDFPDRRALGQELRRIVRSGLVTGSAHP